MRVNFIHDQNPFNLPPPPAWWLRRLYDYDSQLVVIPSRVDRVYRLARRTWNTVGITAVAVIDRHNDSAMLATYGLVPVTSILGWGVWGTNIFNELRRRDIWAAGGAEAYVKAADEFDESQRQAKRAAVRDDLWMRAGDAWHSYQSRTRQRISLGGDNPYGGVGSQQARTERRMATAPSTSGSTAGSGVVLTDAMAS